MYLYFLIIHDSFLVSCMCLGIYPFWFIICSSVCSHTTIQYSSLLWFFCLHPFYVSILFASIFIGLPCGSAGKEFACNAEDLGSIPRLGRSPGEGKDYPLQYSGLENFIMFYNIIVHRVTKSCTWLSDFHFHFIYICSFSFFIYNLIYESFFFFWNVLVYMYKS